MKNSMVMKDLEKVSTLLFSSKCDEARIILQQYVARSGEHSDTVDVDKLHR